MERIAPHSRNLFEEFIQEQDANSETAKSEEQAQAFKELGNQEYKQKQFDEAIKFYTKCIQNSPSESEVLPVAFANRSAVFFQKKEYAKSLLVRSEIEVLKHISIYFLFLGH